MEALLKNAMPELAAEMAHLLTVSGHIALAEQVPNLKLVDRCRCGDDFCSTFYTQPKPNGAYGPGHENIVLDPQDGMIILDVVKGVIACVEVLYRDEVRRTLLATLP